MKNLCLALVALVPALAHAEGLSCQDTKLVPDHGYLVEISRDLSRAEVNAQSIAGPMRVASLSCTKVKEKPTHPDQLLTILTCGEANLADAGYSLRVEKGGIAGLPQATLSEVSIAGAQPVANLICR